MEPAKCSGHKLRKVKINKESEVAVFFDIENMMWKEELLIKQ